jgi:hypothetical protein
MTNTDGNRSHAVVSRRFESVDSLDDFPTPKWATRALIEHVLTPELNINNFRPMSVWEPACNRGHMAQPLSEYFGRVYATDIHDYGYPLMDQEWDAVSPKYPPCIPPTGVDAIITNPPYILAGKVIRRALYAHGCKIVAMLCRTQILESQKRYERIFLPNPPSIVAQFVERVPMIKGRIDPKASTATSYAWLIWAQGWANAPRLVWIPPCRKKLEREGDYL